MYGSNRSFAEREKFGDDVNVSCNAESDSETHAETKYHQYPIKVTRRFRDALIAQFPALESHEWALEYWKMLEYLLYATLKNDEGRLVFPAATLANLIGSKVGEGGFRAIDYFTSFSEHVFPLDVSDYVTGKLARTVRYQLPDTIAAIADREAAATLADDADKVWLVTGREVSAKGVRKACESYENNILLMIDDVDTDHPAYALQQHLNSQSQIALGKHLRKNWHRLLAMHSDMEAGESKNSVGFILLALKDWAKNLYAGSEKTARISTRGITIHSLPRAFRKAALTGSIEMDIKSSQAAIVARLWALEGMNAFLASGASFWTIMLEYLELSVDAKPALKTALYACCFGMGKRKLLSNLAAEIGHEKAVMFFQHPLMVEILRGRSEAMKHVRADGGIRDAFGRWIPISIETPAHALLAIEAQSWELKLMLPVFDTLKDKEGISILSWLHDGVVVAHRDHVRLLGSVASAKRVFDANAKEMGFSTELEISHL